MKQALIIVIMIFISSCSTSSKDDYIDTISLTKFEGDLLEVVFRYAFENNASALQQKADFYSLEIKQRDPEEQYLKRFDDIGIKIYPLSATRFNCKKGVFINNGKGKGLNFDVYDFAFESPTKVIVNWGYSEGCLSSAISHAKLEYIDGVWIMIESKIILISGFIPNKFKNSHSLRSFGLAKASPF